MFLQRLWIIYVSQSQISAALLLLFFGRCSKIILQFELHAVGEEGCHILEWRKKAEKNGRHPTSSPHNITYCKNIHRYNVTIAQLQLHKCIKSKIV